MYTFSVTYENYISEGLTTRFLSMSKITKISRNFIWDFKDFKELKKNGNSRNFKRSLMYYFKGIQIISKDSKRMKKFDQRFHGNKGILKDFNEFMKSQKVSDFRYFNVFDDISRKI